MSNPVGRPTKYKPQYVEKAFKLCLLGATDKQLADFFEVSEQTLNAWKQEHPEFLESLKSGKDEADANVSSSLYHRALGYSHPEEKIFQTSDKDNQEGVIRVDTIKHYPPDPTAAIFWLKNRQKDRWRDTKHSDITINTAEVSEQERAERLSRHLGLEDPARDRQTPIN